MSDIIISDNIMNFVMINLYGLDQLHDYKPETRLIKPEILKLLKDLHILTQYGGTKKDITINNSKQELEEIEEIEEIEQPEELEESYEKEKSKIDSILSINKQRLLEDHIYEIILYIIGYSKFNSNNLRQDIINGFFELYYKLNILLINNNDIIEEDDQEDEQSEKINSLDINIKIIINALIIFDEYTDSPVTDKEILEYFISEHYIQTIINELQKDKMDIGGTKRPATNDINSEISKKISRTIEIPEDINIIIKYLKILYSNDDDSISDEINNNIDRQVDIIFSYMATMNYKFGYFVTYILNEILNSIKYLKDFNIQDKEIIDRNIQRIKRSIYNSIQLTETRYYKILKEQQFDDEKEIHINIKDRILEIVEIIESLILLKDKQKKKQIEERKREDDRKKQQEKKEERDRKRKERKEEEKLKSSLLQDISSSFTAYKDEKLQINNILILIAKKVKEWISKPILEQGNKTEKNALIFKFADEQYKILERYDISFNQGGIRVSNIFTNMESNLYKFFVDLLTSTQDKKFLYEKKYSDSKINWPFENINIKDSSKRFFINNAAQGTNNDDFIKIRFCPLSSMLDPAAIQYGGCTYINPMCGRDSNLDKCREIGNMSFSIINSSNNKKYSIEISSLDNSYKNYRIQTRFTYNNGEINSIFDENIETVSSLSASSIHKNLCELLVNNIKQSYTNKKFDKNDNYWNRIIKDEDFCKYFFGISTKKGLGDWTQILNTAIKFGSYSGTQNNIQYKKGEDIVPYDSTGNGQRLLLATDQLSSILFMFILEYFPDQIINRSAWGGFLSRSQLFIRKRNDSLNLTGGNNKRKNNKRTNKKKIKRRTVRKNTLRKNTIRKKENKKSKKLKKKKKTRRKR